MKGDEKMREIKFRAWDKEHQVMYLPEYSEVRYMSVESLNEDNSLLEIMQYTGVKDKYDKEIYEGDILAWHWDIIDFKNKDTEVGVIEYDLETLQYVLNKYEKKYYPAINNDASYDDGKRALESLFYPEYDYKVIGNIYENSELLEMEQRSEYGKASCIYAIYER